MNLDEIIDEYYGKIYKLCLFYLNNNGSEAEELTQEIFLKVFKKQSSFKGESGIYTWIYRIAVNTLINYIKRKKIVEFFSFESIPEVEGEVADPAEQMEQDENQKQKLELFQACIKRLSNREKAAFFLFHYRELRQKEIAEIMETSVSAIESLIHKAMKKMKKCVKEEPGGLQIG